MYKGHVWSYDFVHHRTHDARVYHMLTIMNEFSREYLSLEVKPKIKPFDVLETLADLFLMHGPVLFIGSDNGPEFITKILENWLRKLKVKSPDVESERPQKNGYIESFNSRLSNELLNREIIYTLNDAKFALNMWRKTYNSVRHHISF